MRASPSSKSSLYPTGHPPGSRIILKRQGSETPSPVDNAIVIFSSLLIIGSFAWIPYCINYFYKRWKLAKHVDTVEGRRSKKIYGGILVAALTVCIVGPHRHRFVGEKLLKFRKWRLWKAWINYVAAEVVSDSIAGNNNNNDINGKQKDFDVKKDQAILAIIPHGLVPFALAFAAIPENMREAFGTFRPVAATATVFFPFVRTFLAWMGAIDASRSAVDQALSAGHRIGLAPGGIGEMFEGYPKQHTHPDDECALLASRKGFIRMAIKHNVPVVPVYVFGASKMLKRLQLPGMEYISKLLRISLCVIFGRLGLPIPIHQRLLYVMGQPLFPPEAASENEEFQAQVNHMHELFCQELKRLFDRHKESYGWGHKRLCLV